MSTINNGIKQNKISDASIAKIDDTRYENIFNVNTVEKNDKSFYFYNTLNKVSLPKNIDERFIDKLSLSYDTPWTTLAFKIYKDIDLWWLIVLANEVDYIFMAKGGREYNFIKPAYVDLIIGQISTKA